MNQIQYTTPDDALKLVSSGDRIYVQGIASTPTILTDALAKRANELKNVEICHFLTLGNAAYANPIYKDSFFVNSFFLGDNVRSSLKTGNGSYIPCFFSKIPDFFINGTIPLDGMLISVSPPDNNGYCSLGVTVEAAMSAIKVAKYVIAQVNENMPKTFGDTKIHCSQITKFVHHNSPIFEIAPSSKETHIEEMIANNVAGLIDDGACLQMGIGSIPNAVLAKLHNYKDLGVHTEMLTDGIVDLAEKGVITGSKKKIDINKIICTFALGSKRLYDFMDNNPSLEVKVCDYTNDCNVISQNDNVISVNSAIEVDLTGQVCADSIGSKMYSGVGGQVDFVRGASMSNGGKSIIAMPSTTKDGKSRIVPFIKTGAGIVTTRTDVQYIITEYGVANVQAKNLKQRHKMLLEIAHPDHREALDKQFYEIWNKDNIR